MSLYSAVATGYLSSSMLRIKEKVTSSRRTVTLLDYTDEVKVSQSQVSGVFSTGKQVNSVEVNDRSVPVMTTRRLSKECDSLSECEDNYIDPRSISTVPYHELVSGNMVSKRFFFAQKCAVQVLKITVKGSMYHNIWPLSHSNVLKFSHV